MNLHRSKNRNYLMVTVSLTRQYQTCLVILSSIKLCCLSLLFKVINVLSLGLEVLARHDSRLSIFFFSMCFRCIDSSEICSKYSE